MRRLFFFMPLAVFAVLAVYFALGLGMDPKIIPSALIDKPVPNQMVGGELAIWGSILDDDLS